MRTRDLGLFPSDGSKFVQICRRVGTDQDKAINIFEAIEKRNPSKDGIQ
jgi:hypothetical protein